MNSQLAIIFFQFFITLKKKKVTFLCKKYTEELIGEVEL